MLQDVIDSPELLGTEEEDISTSPIASHILDFCDDSELFSETLRTSEVSSCSGGAGNSGGCGGSTGSEKNVCCYEDTSFDSTFSSFSSMDPSTLAALLNGPDSDTSIPQFDYSSPPPPLTSSSFPQPHYLLPESQQDQLDQASLTGAAIFNGYASVCPPDQMMAAMPQLPPAPTIFDEECMMPLQGYMGLEPSQPAPNPCSFIDPTMSVFFPTGNMGLAVPGEGMYAGGLLMAPINGAARAPEGVEFSAETASMVLYGSDTTQQLYGNGDLQVMGDNQTQAGGGYGGPTLVASPDQVSSMDESSFKVGRLSVEERKEKIHRYLKKRNERNFSKKIKYACRKTLADSRPRVRGRFAKNDELGEATRATSNNHDDEDDEEVMIKEEDLMMDSSDIFAHLNSFKCNYTLESWI